MGMKVLLSAPSPNIARNILGRRNAIMKASLNMLAPRVKANNISRIYPKILEISVNKLIPIAFLNKLAIVRVYNIKYPYTLLYFKINYNVIMQITDVFVINFSIYLMG